MSWQINSYSASRDNWCTVGGDGGCRVSKVRAGTTSPMPDHKGFKLQELVHFQKFSTLRVNNEHLNAVQGAVLRQGPWWISIWGHWPSSIKQPSSTCHNNHFHINAIYCKKYVEWLSCHAYVTFMSIRLPVCSYMCHKGCHVQGLESMYRPQNS